jgi:hypothetical protein
MLGAEILCSLAEQEAIASIRRIVPTVFFTQVSTNIARLLKRMAK